MLQYQEKREQTKYSKTGYVQQLGALLQKKQAEAASVREAYIRNVIGWSDVTWLRSAEMFDDAPSHALLRIYTRQ